MKSIAMALASLVFASGLAAQIPAGSALVLTQNPIGGPAAFWSVPVAGGAPTAITGIAPPLDMASQVEIDHATGDLIVGVSNGATIEFWRVTLAGTVATSQQLLASLTGSTGVIWDTHREANGCILVLSRTVGGNPVIWRLAVTPAGGSAVQVPVTGPTGSFNAIAADAAGNILFSDWIGGGPNGSTVYSVPPAGGAATAITTLVYQAACLEVNPVGALQGGGLALTLPMGLNYSCGASTISLGPWGGGFGFTPGVVDLATDATGGLTIFGLNGGGIAGGEVRTIPSSCPVTMQGTLVFTFTNQAVIRVVPALPSGNYGCPCATSLGQVPLISEVAPPTLGQNWTVNLTGVPGFTTALYLFSTQNLSFRGMPTPTDLGYLGAPGCFALNGAESITGSVINGAGVATATRFIPNVPSLIGMPLYSQWGIRDGAANNLGIVTSAGLQSIIQ